MFYLKKNVTKYNRWRLKKGQKQLLGGNWVDITWVNFLKKRKEKNIN